MSAEAAGNQQEASSGSGTAGTAAQVSAHDRAGAPTLV
jgi:hypothetical protein